MLRPGMLFLGLIAAGCARAAAAPGVLDLTADFLGSACAAPPGEPFARAWLEHERRAWNVYGALYYPDGGGEREAAAAALGPRRDEVCKQARAFAVAAPAVLAAVRPTVTRLAGAAPRAAPSSPRRSWATTAAP